MSRDRAALVPALLTLALTPCLCAQAGTLDPTFLAPLGYGTVATSNGGQARAVALQADGRILLGGSDGLSLGRWLVARLLDDGTLDQSFGGGGVVYLTGLVSYATITELAVDPQGRILATGRDSQFRVARLLGDGSLDPSFGTGGMVTTAIQYSSQSVALELVPGATPADYFVVVAGQSAPRNGSNAFTVARYRADGSLDTTGFGPRASKRGTATTGYLIDDITGNHDQPQFGALAVAADGKLLVGGNTGALSPIDSPFVLARYTSAGALDTTFGTGGHLLDDFGDTSQQLRGIAIQPDGRILASGRRHGAGGFLAPVVARYLASGSRDTSFGISGQATTGFLADHQPAAGIALDGAGRITLATTWTPTGGDTQCSAVRFLADGTLDLGFGSGGLAELAGTPTSGEMPLATLRDGSGRLLAAGSAGSVVFVVRYQ